MISAAGRDMAGRLARLVSGETSGRRRTDHRRPGQRRCSTRPRSAVCRKAGRDDLFGTDGDRRAGGARAHDPRGRQGPASVGTRDAGEDGGCGRRRTLRARSYGEDVEDTWPRRPCADTGTAYRRSAGRLLGYDREHARCAPSGGRHRVRGTRHCEERSDEAIPIVSAHPAVDTGAD